MTRPGKLAELLALDGVKHLATKKVKRRRTKKHEGERRRVDLVRCREPRAFVVVESIKGVICRFTSRCPGPGSLPA